MNENSKGKLGTWFVQNYAHWVVKWRWLIIPEHPPSHRIRRKL